MNKIWLFAALPAIALMGASASAQDGNKADVAGPFVTSPVMLNTTSASVTVNWLEKKQDITVRQGTEVQTSAPLEVRSATFTHLKPDTVYTYNAGPAGTGKFKTPPLKGVPFEFLMWAESRNGNVSNAIEQQDKTNGDNVHSKLIATMSKENPDFVMHLGDAIQTGPDQSEWFDFMKITAPLLRKASMALVYGNHEANAPLVHQIFNQPKTYYSFNWGTSHFIVLDSEYDRVRLAQSGKSMPTEQEALWQEQMTWLKEELEANKGAENIFVAFHLPPYTATAYKRRDRTFRIQQQWVPLFEKYGVTVLNGHEHNYQRGRKNGVHYQIVGSAGASLERVEWPEPGVTQKALSTFAYTKFKVNGKNITMEAYDLDGKKIDEAVVK